jgi:hypothetical protein
MKIHSKVLELFQAYRGTDMWKDGAILTGASQNCEHAYKLVSWKLDVEKWI